MLIVQVPDISGKWRRPGFLQMAVDAWVGWPESSFGLHILPWRGLLPGLGAGRSFELERRGGCRIGPSKSWRVQAVGHMPWDFLLRLEGPGWGTR